MTVLAPIQRFDDAFSSLCLTHRFNLQVASLSRAISHTGDGHLYMLFGLLALALDHQQGITVLFVGVLAFLIELPIYFVLKNSVKRNRPTCLPSFIKPSDKYSLPSGHTAAACIMAALISTFYPSIAVGIWLWAGLIGLSRVLLGVHFITDIVAGALLGVVSFEIAMRAV